MITPRSLRRTLALVVAAAALAVTALANPTGTWKWTANGPQGPIEVTGQFELSGDTVTGTVSARGNDAAISDGKFHDGTVSFTVVREFRGEKRYVNYSGKLEGDTITGTLDRPRPDGDREIVEWKATRAP